MNDGRLRSTFERAGLTTPWVPPEFKARLREHTSWCFSTLDVPSPSPYDLRAYQALAADGVNFLVIAHAGHGINSYALSYFLKCGSFTLLLQLEWGGAYMREPEATQRVNAMFGVLNEWAVELSRAEGHIESSDFYSTDRLEPTTLRMLLQDSLL